MGIKDHPAGSKSRGGNPFLPHSLRGGNVVPFLRKPAPPVETKNGVPVGTSVQIQEWVGDDPDRALRALQRERESERPRITLVSNLQSVLKKHSVQQPELEASEDLPALEAVPDPVETIAPVAAEDDDALFVPPQRQER